MVSERWCTSQVKWLFFDRWIITWQRWVSCIILFCNFFNGFICILFTFIYLFIFCPLFYFVADCFSIARLLGLIKMYVCIYPSVTGILQETCTPSGFLGHIPSCLFKAVSIFPRKVWGIWKINALVRMEVKRIRDCTILCDQLRIHNITYGVTVARQFEGKFVSFFRQFD